MDEFEQILCVYTCILWYVVYRFARYTSINCCELSVALYQNVTIYNIYFDKSQNNKVVLVSIDLRNDSLVSNKKENKLNF
jgi:hypothetical protein